MNHGQMKWVAKKSFLRVTALSNLFFRMGVRIRQYTPAGRLIEISEAFSVDFAGDSSSFFIQLNEGWIESVSIVSSGTVVVRGQVFIQLSIQEDEEWINSPHTILAADYFVSSVGLQWPGTPIRHYRDGAGFLTKLAIGGITAGANFSSTVPASVVRRIMSVSFRLAADANVANRRPILEVVTGGSLAHSFPTFTTQAAGTTFDSFFMPIGSFFTSVVSGVMITFLSQDLYLKEGDVLQSRIDAMQVGDQLSNIVIHYEEWLEER